MTQSCSRPFLRSLLPLVAACLLLGACAGAGYPSQEAPMSISSPAEGYRLEPGNRVHVVVFGENNLSGDFTLDPAGSLVMPLVGSVPASGVTVPVVAKRIEDLLRRNGYLQEPKVAVDVVSFRPFYVMGEVRQPGEFPYMSGMTVLSAVARAGGYDYRAREGEAVLVRMENGEQREYHAIERTPIMPGDIIKILQRHF